MRFPKLPLKTRIRHNTSSWQLLNNSSPLGALREATKTGTKNCSNTWKKVTLNKACL